MTTADESVSAIMTSVAFAKAAQSYQDTAPLPKNRDSALKGLRVFTDGEIADTSIAGHRRIRDELQRMFDHVEGLRLARHWTYSHPERQAILGMLKLENVLLQAAEIAEEI